MTAVPPPLLVLVLLSVAAACDVCRGSTEYTGPTSVVVLDGDLSACNCVFTFIYSEGSQGRLRLTLPTGLGLVRVFDDGREFQRDFRIAEYDVADSINGGALFAYGGGFRVEIETNFVVPPDARIVMSVAALNVPPVVVEREGLDKIDFLDGFLYYPFGTHPLPVFISDPDNNDLGLRVNIRLTAATDTLTYGVRVPDDPRISFLNGAPNTTLTYVSILGPGSAIDQVIAQTEIVALSLTTANDRLSIEANDFGNAGDSIFGSGTITFYAAQLHVYARGVLDVKRGQQIVNSGAVPEGGTEAIFRVHDAALIEFTRLDLPPDDDGGCSSYIRVWAGTSPETGILLSTDLALSGEICGSNDLLPTYVSVSGEFYVEFNTLLAYRFESTLTPTPIDFSIWLLDGDLPTIDAVSGGDAIRLPQIMISSLPDPDSITVTFTTEVGSVGLAFADSYVDIIDSTSGTSFTQSMTLQATSMLRLGDALQQLLYVPPADGYMGSDTVTVEAQSGGESVQSVLTVTVTGTAINLPDSLTVHAFQPVPISLQVALGPTDDPAITLATSSGIGVLSVDPRAAQWFDVGYADTITVTDPADLDHLVYKGLDGGNDAIVVTAGSSERRLIIQVDPECLGEHIIYGRSGSFAEKAGAPTSPHSAELLCTWEIIGARRLTFPFFELNADQILWVRDSEETELYRYLLSPPPTTLFSEEAVPYFFVELLAFGPEQSPGFVGVLDEQDGVDDPPLVIVPTERQQVIRQSRTRLAMLYANDFGDGSLRLSLTTDIGWLDQVGTQVVEFEAESFEVADAWLTSREFVAGDEQAVASLALRALDAGGGATIGIFEFEILPCSGTIDVVLPTSDAEAVVSDGSGISDYPGDLVCGWRLTGAAAPAELQVQFVDLDCNGDILVVFDGASAAGREIARLCQAPDQALISTTGAFFLSMLSNQDGLQEDGFSFVYRSIRGGEVTELGAAPVEADPVRTGAVVATLDQSTVVVHGGNNGVRAVASTLVHTLDGGWAVLTNQGDSPGPGSERAGSGIGDNRLIVHGGLSLTGVSQTRTWVAEVDLDAGTVTWTRPSTAQLGPETVAPGMDGFILVDTTGTWELVESSLTWEPRGSVPEGLIGSSLAGGHAVDVEGRVWRLSSSATQWTQVASVAAPSCVLCTGAMLGADEYVVDNSRVNVTSGAVDAFDVPSGSSVGGSYFGQPALFVFGSGSLRAVTLALGVNDHLPLVSPVDGGTQILVSGERLSTCGNAVCQIGDNQAALLVQTERTAICVAPATGGLAGPADVLVTCDDGRAYTSAGGIEYHQPPTIQSIQPEAPQPGDTLLIELDQESSRALTAAVDTVTCRFDGGETSLGAVDAPFLRCTLPAKSQQVEISLDGQLYTASSELPEPISSGGSSDDLVAVGSAMAVVVVVAVILVVRFQRRSRINNGPAPWKIDFEALELKKILGSGGFGTVYHGTFRGGDVAIKMIKEGTASAEAIDSMQKEAALMAELRHPNIVLFMGACTESPNIAIVLEFLHNGPLSDLLYNDEFFARRAEMFSFSIDIAKGMAYLHGADPPIVHRDLKSPNVLVDKNFVLKVSDFGLTEIFKDTTTQNKGDQTQSSQDGVWSVYWTAPEVLRGGPSTRASDMYSFGITMWEICAQDVPYGGIPPGPVIAQVSRGVGYRPVADRAIPEPFNSIIQRCWAEVPDMRPTFAEVQEELCALADIKGQSLSGDGESILSDSEQGNMIELADGHVVALRIAGMRVSWEDDPLGTRQAIDQFQHQAAELAAQNDGQVFGDGDVGLYVFATLALAEEFCNGIKKLDGVPVAGARAPGRIRMGYDHSTRGRRATGPAVHAALTLVWRTSGGEIAVWSDESSKTAAGSEPLRAEPDPSWMLDHEELTLGKLIGAGSFGTVFQATWRGTEVAAKQLHRKRLGANGSLDLQMEGGVASKLRHPNICQVLGVSIDPDGGKIYVVSELMARGSVSDAVVLSRKAIAPKIKVDIARDVARGIQYLHAEKIVHRSLTARNVMLGKDWTAKVSDFGLARVKDQAATMTKVGTTAYSAPEMLRGKRYSEKIDVYAFAIVLWEMLAQESAFGGERIVRTLDKILDGQRPEVADEWRSNPELSEYVKVMEACWVDDEEERPAFESLFTGK